MLNKKNGSKKIQAKKILPLARLITSKYMEANRKKIKESPHKEASNTNIVHMRQVTVYRIRSNNVLGR